MANKSFYTKKLGEIVARYASPSFLRGRYHVISGMSGKWAVVPGGHVKPIKSFVTQSEAISYAKESALRTTGEVIIHSKTGQMRDKISFAK